jgi:hypothetical protein
MSIQNEFDKTCFFTFRLGRNDYQDIVVQLTDFERDKERLFLKLEAY